MPVQSVCIKSNRFRLVHRTGLENRESTFSNLIMSCFSRQMPVDSHWTQTQPTDISLCLRTTVRWSGLERIRGILTTERDLTPGTRCCVERVWLAAVTGRWRGEDMLVSEWHTEESQGEERVVTAGLEGTTSPGVFIVLMMVTLPVTTVVEQTSLSAPLAPPE